MYSAELRQADFTQPPEVLDTVDMVVSIGKFILTMLDSIMLFISKICQSVVGSKSVGVDACSRVGFAFDNGQQLACRAVFDDLLINLITSFEHAENRNFTFSSSASFTANNDGTVDAAITGAWT